MLSGGETVVILTATAVTDPYSGTPVGLSWATPGEVSVADVLCEPRPSGEPVQDARNAVTSGFTLYFQTVPAVLPTPANRVRVRGLDYRILGEPADWRFGSFRGLVVQCERTSG